MESIINDNTTHDPEDYEAIHDHLADEDDIYNESYIISKKNYEINMDKWKPGTPLWITGSSGDGKSTYANQLAKEKKAFLVPLDLFLVRIAKPKEKYDKFLNDTSGTVISNGSQMVLEYINKHPEIPWADNVKGNWGTSGQDPELWNGLFDWLIDASAKNPKYKTKLIIFEGCNICLMPVEKAVKFPFIIMGTSRLQSSIRRIKRDKKEHDDYSIFKLVYRELKRSTKGVLPSLNKTKDNFEKGLKKQMKTINESSNVLMSNDEFFMEASKNPDVKARKRTVKNLRRIGVDRAHEVDNRKMIDKLERQLLDLSKKWRNGEMSFSDYYDASEPLKKQIRKLEKGIDIEFTDSYGKKHKTKLSSNNQTSDSYDLSNDTVNITPKIMNSNKFDSTLNHELGHVEQNKRYGFDKIDRRGYDVSDNDDYLIKCAKLFVKKNLDKLNSHDNMWTELHADVLSCKKSGFGKMIKDVYSFKKSKTEVENAIDDCIKRDEEYRTKIEKEHLKAYNEKGERFTPSQKDVDECIALYEEAKSKLEHTYEILNKRYKALEHQKFFGPWDMTKEYKTKLDKVFNRVKEKWGKIYQEKDHLDWKIEHNGLAAKDAIAYNKKMESHLKFYADELKDLQAAFTTYDYRIMFMEDMKHIHEGHPERCSMKYPPMTPEDKKYMQETDCVLVSNEEFFTEAKTTFKQDLHKSNKSNSRVQNVVDRNAIKAIIRNKIEVKQHKYGRVVELHINLNDRFGNININDIDWSKGLKITSHPKHIHASEENWYNETLNELKQSYDKYVRLMNQNKQNPSEDVQSQIKELQEDMLDNAEDLAEESSFPFELKNGKNVDTDDKKRQAFFYIHDLLEKINEANQTKNMKQLDAARSELGALMNIKDPNSHPFEYKLTNTICEVTFLEREYKIYPRKNTTRFIHFSKKPNLTSLNPGNEYLSAIYGDDPHETTGPQTRWLYKGMVVHFWAVENNTMSYGLLGHAEELYGDYAYEYIPSPSDKFYMDDTEGRKDQNSRSVILKTDKPLPVKQINPDELTPKEQTVHESCLIMDNDEFFGLMK